MQIMSFLFVILYFMVASSEGQGHGHDTSCPPGYTHFGQSCYAYMQGKLEWAQAEITCGAIHAHLAEIYSDEDNEFILNFTSGHGADRVWLGAHDLVMEGTWTWSWSSSGLDEYSDWAPGQPDDGHDEDCLEMNVHMAHWNDENCDHEKNYICQTSANSDIIG